MPTPSSVNNLLQFLIVSVNFADFQITRIKEDASQYVFYVIFQPIGIIGFKRFNNPFAKIRKILATSKEIIKNIFIFAIIGLLNESAIRCKNP